MLGPLGSEAPGDIDDTIDLVLLTDSSQIVYRGRVRRLDEHVMIINVLLKEPWNHSILVPCDYAVDSLLHQCLGSVRSYEAVEAADDENHCCRPPTGVFFMFDPTVMTIFPRALPCPRYCMASPTSSNL